MRTIYITRHAKSSWADLGMSDHDRPLNERGLLDAPYMAKVFRERGEPLDLLLTSTANRALSTALIFAKELGIDEANVQREEQLYHSTVPTLMRTLQMLPNEAHRVMLFGHNPGLTDLVAYLGGEDIGNLPTCGTVCIEISVDDWKLVSREWGTMVWMDYPKQHAGHG